jgi:hypothetical protein
LIILLNVNKIDELYNLLNIIYYNKKFDIINYENYEKFIKNNYIYNTTYYNNVMGLETFNYFSFLSDLKTTIEYYSNPANVKVEDFTYIDQNKNIYIDPEKNKIYIIYKKCINDGVINFIDNVSLYFQLINEQIIGIYKFIKNIDLGSLPKIDINIPDNISNLYFLLTQFKNNVSSMFDVITTNNINIFEDFIPAVDFFNSYYNDINEFLLSVQIANDINNISIPSTIIQEDILNILNINEIYDQIKIFINNINKLYVLSDLDLINYYLKLVNTTIEITDVTLHDVVVYDDFNVVQNENFPIFNFNSQLLITLQKNNNITASLYDYYYNTPNIDFYKNYINYNYITSSLLYVNIQNNN